MHNNKKGTSDERDFSPRHSQFPCLLVPPLSSWRRSQRRVEVVHWWTSGGEKAAVDVSRPRSRKTASPGRTAPSPGGGATADDRAKSRAVAGNPPGCGADQRPGHPGMGVHRPCSHRGALKDVAKREKWDGLLDKKVADTVKYEGDYVAVPVNIHRVNWLWINPEVFKKAGHRQGAHHPRRILRRWRQAQGQPASFAWPMVASRGRTAPYSRRGALGNGRRWRQEGPGGPGPKTPDRPGDDQGLDRAEKSRHLHGPRPAGQ